MILNGIVLKSLFSTIIFLSELSIILWLPFISKTVTLQSHEFHKNSMKSLQLLYAKIFSTALEYGSVFYTKSSHFSILWHLSSRLHNPLDSFTADQILRFQYLEKQLYLPEVDFQRMNWIITGSLEAQPSLRDYLFKAILCNCKSELYCSLPCLT